jgi:hypothetical protein
MRGYSPNYGHYVAYAMLRMRALPAGFIAPCLPTKTDKLPSGELWLRALATGPQRPATEVFEISDKPCRCSFQFAVRRARPLGASGSPGPSWVPWPLWVP